jgi:hypothetical protein
MEHRRNICHSAHGAIMKPHDLMAIISFLGKHLPLQNERILTCRRMLS